MSGLSPYEPAYPVIKRLLDNYRIVWLFEIRAGQLTTYQVERDERIWTFASLSSARAKSDREVSRLPNGAIALGPDKHATDDPGESKTAEGGPP
jgi:hypothetical protein